MPFPDPNSIYSILVQAGGQRPKNGLDTALSVFRDLQSRTMSKKLAVSKYSDIEKFGVLDKSALSAEETAQRKEARAQHKGALSVTSDKYKKLADQATLMKSPGTKTNYQGQTVDLPEEPFPNKGPLSDKQLMRLLFEGTNADTMRQVFGPGTNFEVFRTRFKESAEYNLERLEDMAQIFANKSFPETYFHPSIARRLFQYGKLIDPKLVEERVGVTAFAVVNILDGNSPRLLSMLAMATSHFGTLGRGQGNYNENTAEYTLLTFSLFGARRLKKSDEGWFFIWKVLGSALGLPPDRLHDGVDAANLRMRELRKDCWPKGGVLGGLINEQQVLLKAWVQAMEWDDPHKLKEVNDLGAISARMEHYLRLTKCWPHGLQRNKVSADMD